MKKLRISLEQFQKEWRSRPNKERFRHAVGSILGKNRTLRVEIIQEMQTALCDWFGRRLYMSGYFPKTIEGITDESDYGYQVGAGYDIKAKKQGKLIIGRYLCHLLLLIESQKREIDFLKGDTKAIKKYMLIYEKALIKLVSNKKIPQKLRDKLREKFGYLFGEI